ncbi:hypothetical protein AB3S75_020953 [Citrus x aurantiifolia]
MSKRARLELDTKQDEILVDWLSRLPDEILVNIISRLAVREAARTSVLSSRWKYLWTFTTCLNFSALKMLWNVKKDPATLEEERYNYINWVNDVLDSHMGLCINEFRLCFELRNSHGSFITHWIFTALAKKVQKLELNLHPVGGGFWPPLELYSFPLECLKLFRSPRTLSNIKSLRSLCLDAVNVSGEVLEFFIYSCPLLDRLRVVFSLDLLSLKVVGSSVKLKYLDICYCYFMEEVEISAPSVRSFKYYGPEIKLRMENVPQLLDISIGGGYGVRMKHAISPIMSYFHQLETLELGFVLNAENMQFPQCELPKLRHLTFNVLAFSSKSLLGLSCMMEASTFLQKFTLKLQTVYVGSEIVSERKFRDCLHQHLKVVELIGFVGLPIELELAFYLLKSATTLEKMIVDPTPPAVLGTPWEFENYKKKQAARSCAKELEPKIPKGVELVIL